jgi:hypothetical protein
MFATLTIPAHGDDERMGASFGTFGELGLKCASADPTQQGYCAGVVSGTLGTVMFLKDGLVCLPTDKDLTLGEVTHAALKILDDIPAFGDMQETEGLTYGLSLAYPCPKS